MHSTPFVLPGHPAGRVWLSSWPRHRAVAYRPTPIPSFSPCEQAAPGVIDWLPTSTL